MIHYEYSHGGSYGRRVKLTSRVRAEGRPCWICTLPIDYALKGGGEAFNLDELIPRAHGGSPLDYGNVDATHACCNNWRRTRSVALVVRIREWLIASGKPWATPAQFVELAKQAEHALRAGTAPEKLEQTCEW